MLRGTVSCALWKSPHWRWCSFGGTLIGLAAPCASLMTFQNVTTVNTC